MVAFVYPAGYEIQSDLVYPNSLLPINMCSHCETWELLNHFKIENDIRGYQEVCSDCEAYRLKKHGLTRSDSIVHEIKPY